MKKVKERIQILSDTSNDYRELHISNQEYDTISNDIPEYPFNWINVIIEMAISIILAFGIFFIICEIHEIARNENVAKMTEFNNIVEAVFLFIVFSVIVFHIIKFRWNRNCWYDIIFDNYPMLVMMCIYFLIEVVYYILNYISIFTTCYKLSRPIATTMELLFMIGILPFLIISIKHNVTKSNIWLKMRTKIFIMLAMVGSLLIFSRKIAIKFKNDFGSPKNKNICNSNITLDINVIHNLCTKALNILEIVDINYFLIAFVLLINPLFKLEKHDEYMDNLDNSISLKSQTPFSILTWISLVRFRMLTVILSFFMISLISVALYLSSNVIIDKTISNYNKNLIMNIFLGLVTISYIICTVYGIFYYFVDLNTWTIEEKKELKSDQYFNYMTSFCQMVYSSTMLIGLVNNYSSNTYETGSILISQILNYSFLSVQIMIQAACINSASQRTIRKYTDSEVDTWKFRLIPPVILASFNFITMVVSMAYTAYPQYSMFQQNIDNTNGIWLFMKDFTLPLTILNRFHAMTFFINLTAKQWK